LLLVLALPVAQQYKTIADAVTDRVIHSHHMQFAGESLRKVKGLATKVLLKSPA